MGTGPIRNLISIALQCSHAQAVCLRVLVLSIFVFAVLFQPVRAQQTRSLPSAEKIVDNYLKAIGGKKLASSIRDASYEWTIQLRDQPMGSARVQFKAPASQLSEMTLGNGQIIS